MSATFRNVYWIGGSSCAGKSSVAKKLADTYPFFLFKIDDYIGTFERVAQAHHHPILSELATLPWEERRVRLVELDGENELKRHEEVFSFVIKELEKVAGQYSRVIVEGSSLLPWKVSQFLHAVHHAIWLTPTREFQIDTYPTRGPWVQEILGSVQKPDEVFKNWMEREQYIADKIRAALRSKPYRHLLIDGSNDIAAVTREVAAWFQLRPMVRKRRALQTVATPLPSLRPYTG